MTLGQQTEMHKERNRVAYAAIIAIVIVAGLGSRSRWAIHLPTFIAAYAGDTLWALMIYLGLGFILPRAKVRSLAIAAISISFAIEVSELYQADWINRIRNTTLGGLVLGFGFKWSDLVCYTTGILIGALGNHWLHMRADHAPTMGCTGTFVPRRRTEVERASGRGPNAGEP